jgi:hypothetical protein
VNTRILSPEEWSRLDASRLPELLQYCRPQDVAIVAVEDGATLAACMAVLQVTHFEGVWVDPAYRGNPGVMRPLLRQAFALPRMRGEQWAMGAAAHGDDRMRGFMERLGARLPMDLYAVKVGEEEQCHQQ